MADGRGVNDAHIFFEITSYEGMGKGDIAIEQGADKDETFDIIDLFIDNFLGVFDLVIKVADTRWQGGLETELFPFVTAEGCSFIDKTQ